MAVSSGENRPQSTTLKAEHAVQLYCLEAACALFSEPEQQDVLAALEPLVRVARVRAQVRQPSRVGPPLIGRITG